MFWSLETLDMYSKIGSRATLVWRKLLWSIAIYIYSIIICSATFIPVRTVYISEFLSREHRPRVSEERKKNSMTGQSVQCYDIVSSLRQALSKPKGDT